MPPEQGRPEDRTRMPPRAAQILLLLAGAGGAAACVFALHGDESYRRAAALVHAGLTLAALAVLAWRGRADGPGLLALGGVLALVADLPLVFVTPAPAGPHLLWAAAATLFALAPLSVVTLRVLPGVVRADLETVVAVVPVPGGRERLPDFLAAQFAAADWAADTRAVLRVIAAESWLPLLIVAALAVLFGYCLLHAAMLSQWLSLGQDGKGPPVARPVPVPVQSLAQSAGPQGPAEA